MKKYDIEQLEEDLLAIVQSNLPAKLAEIDAEKNDGIILVAPTDSQYFSTTDDEVNNESVFIMYGADDSETVSIASSTSEDVKYFFIVYTNDINSVPGETRKRILRYSRALKEVINENFRSISFASSLVVATVAPFSWGENERSPVYKAGGIYLRTTLVG